MRDSKKQFRHKIIFAVCVMAVISSYSAAMLVSAFSFNGLPGPIGAVKMLFTSGTVRSLALAIFAVGTAVVIYSMYRSHSESRYEDKMGRNMKRARNGDPYGDAHFEEPEEYRDVAQIRPIDKCKGVILGQLGDNGKECIDFNLVSKRMNDHFMIVGASGSGKTFTFVKNKIFQTVKQGRSLIITDPDGGLYRDMAGYLMDNGYVVRQLNFANPSKSDGWDCMGSLRNPLNREVNTSIFAHVIAENISTGNKDGIYVSGPASLLQALTLYVLLSDDIADKDRNIRKVIELLNDPNGVEGIGRHFDEHTINREALPSIGPWRTFVSASQNLAGNLLVNLGTGLRLLQTEQIANIMSTDDIDLTRPGLEQCAYFCQFPDSQDTFKFLISLFFTMLFISLIDYADNYTADGRLPVTVEFVLDEFPSIGVIPDWDKKMATVRKRGMNVTMICQNITQLRENYKDSWSTIISNCATIISLGINEAETAKWFEQRIGEFSVEVQTRKDGNPLRNNALKELTNERSVGSGRRSLLTASELEKLGPDDTIILFQRHNPIWAHMVPHTLHPESQKLRTILPTSRPDFDDREAREQMRREEEERIERTRAQRAAKPPEDEDDGEAPRRGKVLNTIGNAIRSGAPSSGKRTVRRKRGSTRKTGAGRKPSLRPQKGASGDPDDVLLPDDDIDVDGEMAAGLLNLCGAGDMDDDAPIDGDYKKAPAAAPPAAGANPPPAGNRTASAGKPPKNGAEEPGGNTGGAGQLKHSNSQYSYPGSGRGASNRGARPGANTVVTVSASDANPKYDKSETISAEARMAVKNGDRLDADEANAMGGEPIRQRDRPRNGVNHVSPPTAGKKAR